jgi:hypothetical protein
MAEITLQYHWGKGLFSGQIFCKEKGVMTMRNRWFIFAVLIVLILSSVAAAQQSSGTIRGYVFRDNNGNGVFDEGEEGVPEVLVTISLGDYAHTYYTGGGDTAPQASSTKPNPAPGPGSYGPTPLPGGYWKVTVHVPDGYRATTPTEVFVNVPDDGSATGVNFGLLGSAEISYAGGTGVGMGGGGGYLPATGSVNGPSLGQLVALLAALAGILVLVGTPWCVTRAKLAHKRWW